MRCTPDAAGRSRPDEAGRYASLTVPSRAESIRPAAAFIVQAARDMQVPAASGSLFENAIAEALNNALKHGNPALRPEASIVCEVELVDHCLTVRVFDQGQGFELSPTPRRECSADDVTTIPESGFGIAIIQSVFPMVRTIARPGEFGVEMALTF